MKMRQDHNPHIAIEIPSTKKLRMEKGVLITASFLMAIACIVSVTSLNFGNFGQNSSSDVTASASLAVPVVENNPKVAVDQFAGISLQANAAYVFDIKNQKILFAKNADEPLPLASITKMMTAEVATEFLPQDTVVSINNKNFGKDGDNSLRLNERWSFKKLLDYTLAVSSNDGAAAIGSAVGRDFVSRMNDKASSLDLNSMRFYNDTGLDLSADQSGAVGSASDVARLFEYIFNTHPSIFEATRRSKLVISSLDNIPHIAINTDGDIDKIPGIIGSKTGFTDLAGGNLAVIYDAGVNDPIVAVVLGSTYDGRFSDMTTLINTANKALSLQN